MTRYAACAVLSITGLPCDFRMHSTSQIGLLQVQSRGSAPHYLPITSIRERPLLALGGKITYADLSNTTRLQY